MQRRLRLLPRERQTHVGEIAHLEEATPLPCSPLHPIGTALPPANGARGTKFSLLRPVIPNSDKPPDGLAVADRRRPADEKQSRAANVDTQTVKLNSGGSPTKSVSRAVRRDSDGFPTSEGVSRDAVRSGPAMPQE